jgi:capsular polysaccharide biosynthesis protein
MDARTAGEHDWNGPPTDGGPLESFLASMRRWWWLPLATAVLATAAALAVTSRETPRYAATATAVVAPTAEVESSELLRSLDTLERRTVVATFARIAGTRESRTASAEHLGLRARDVSGHRISASVVSSTNLIRIRVEGPDPETAAALANAATHVTRLEAERLYRVFTLHPVEAATPPARPIHPDPQRNAGVGMVLGLFLGVLVVSGVTGARRPGGGAPVAEHVGPGVGHPDHGYPEYAHSDYGHPEYADPDVA